MSTPIRVIGDAARVACPASNLLSSSRFAIHVVRDRPVPLAGTYLHKFLRQSRCLSTTGICSESGIFCNRLGETPLTTRVQLSSYALCFLCAAHWQIRAAASSPLCTGLATNRLRLDHSGRYRWAGDQNGSRTRTDAGFSGSCPVWPGQ